MIRTTLALALVLLVAPASASASTYAGERPANPTVQSIAAMAGHYWDVMGAPRCNVRLLQAPDLDNAWGRGEGSTCSAWISDDLAFTVGQRDNTDDLLDGCQAVTHEIGHARGLPHSTDGPMASEPPAKKFDNVPWFCVQWMLREWRASLKRADYVIDVPYEMRRIGRYVRRNRS